MQVIKGYVEDGEIKEIVFDVACSDGLDVNTNNYRCPDNGAQVNLDDCSYDSSTGSSELKKHFGKIQHTLKAKEYFIMLESLKIQPVDGQHGML